MQERDHVAQLGTLDRGAADPAAPENSLLVARNRENDERGASRKRPGRREDARLAVYHGPDTTLSTTAQSAHRWAAAPAIASQFVVPTPIPSVLTGSTILPIEVPLVVPTPTTTGGGNGVTATPETVSISHVSLSPFRVIVEIPADPGPGPGNPKDPRGPLLTVTLASMSGTGQTQTVKLKLVYCTSAGEGDDMFQSVLYQFDVLTSDGSWDTHVPGVHDRSIDFSQLDFFGNGAGLVLPFHLRKVKVLEHDPSNGTIKLDTPRLVDINDHYKGWNLYLYAPRLGDETRKGYNPEFDPLYNKLKPNATIKSFDAASQTFTLDRAIPDLFANDVVEAERWVSLMLPDREGLPVIRWNLYASFYDSADATKYDGNDWYLVHQGWEYEVFTGKIVPKDVVDGTPNAPSGRVTRTAPTIATSEASEVLHETGARVPAQTGIDGGEWQFRYAWETSHEDIILDDGWVPIRDDFYIGQKRPRVITDQQMWPSLKGLARVKTNEKVDVTLPAFPTGVHKAHVYAKKSVPSSTITLSTGSSDAWKPKVNFFAIGQPLVNALTDSASTKRDSVFTVSWNTADTTQGGLGGISNMSARDEEYSSFGRVGSGGLPNIHRSTILSGGVGYDTANWMFDFDLTGITPSTISTVELVIDAQVARADHRDDSPAYETGANYSIQFRRWDEAAGTWTVIHTITNFGATNTTEESSTFINNGDGTVTTILDGPLDAGTEGPKIHTSIPWEFDATDLDGNLQVVDVVFLKDGVADGTCAAGLIFDRLVLNVYQSLTDTGPDDRTYWQGETDSTSLSFDKPLVVYGGLAMHEAPSAQWPITVVGRPISDSAGLVKQYEDYAGCADSVFIKKHSTLQRVWQEESSCWGQVCENKWRFAMPPAAGRIFFCNEGRKESNLYFDGASTIQMGFDDPPTDIGGFQSREPPEDDGQTGFESEYWYCWKRVVTAEGRSYLDRSKLVRYTPPGLVFSPTASEQAAQDGLSIYRLPEVIAIPERHTPIDRGPEWHNSVAGPLAPPWWATHVEFYRSFEGGTTPALAFEITLNTSGMAEYGVVDQDARLRLDHVDKSRDFDLTIPGNFFSGKPPAARFMVYSQGRIWFVQQEQRELVSWTNPSSIAGLPAYAEFYSKNTIDPEMPRAAEISALVPYAGRVLAHSLTHVTPIVLNTAGQPQVGRAFASEGAVGPDAWAIDDKTLWYWGKSGPHIFIGTEGQYVGHFVKEIANNINQSPPGRHLVELEVYTAGGRRQLVCGYTEKGSLICENWVVLDLRTAPLTGTGETIWSEWTEMESYGTTITENHNGDERLLIGDKFGRVHIHDTATSDNGRFINWRCQTKAMSLAGSSSSKPRYLYLKLAGRTGDVVLLNMNYDYYKDAINTRPAVIPISTEKFKLWGEEIWNEGSDWGEENGGRYYGDQRNSLPAVAGQVQVDIFQEWDDLPPGTPRDAQVQCAGYYILSERRSRRKAGVS